VEHKRLATPGEAGSGFRTVDNSAFLRRQRCNSGGRQSVVKVGEAVQRRREGLMAVVPDQAGSHWTHYRPEGY
jgi:hypothetical protein